MKDWFKTIGEHWAHFLERDIAPEAPPEQASEMKRAFAAGAVSGFQLCLLEVQQHKGDDLKAALQTHIDSFKDLVKP